ncbi:protein of unknown function [Burkholderia multivorans]
MSKFGAHFSAYTACISGAQCAAHAWEMKYRMRTAAGAAGVPRAADAGPHVPICRLDG